MSSELDDLFRQQLDGHASTPGPDLWARLQARTAADEAAARVADPLDARFRAGLAGHATPPPRELWERLEDEHLRPRQRRRPVVAWGRLAIAASLLLLVLAGGTGWWRHRAGQGADYASAPRPAAGTPAGSGPAAAAATGAAPAGSPATLATTAAPAAAPLAEAGQRAGGAEATLAAATPAGREKTAKTFTAQATGFGLAPSDIPVAHSTRPRRPATTPPALGLPQAGPTPDAAANPLGGPGGRNTPAAGPPPAPALAQTTPPAEREVILVEVRRGPAPGAPAATPAVVAAAPTPRRRLRLGGLLRQAGNLVQGEAVSLADAGLPDSLTLQTRLGGRRLGGTLRL